MRNKPGGQGGGCFTEGAGTDVLALLATLENSDTLDSDSESCCDGKGPMTPLQGAPEPMALLQESQNGMERWAKISLITRMRAYDNMMMTTVLLMIRR